MAENSFSDLKNDLENFVEDFGAYTMQVANPRRGFENAITGCHPRDIFENCNSVVVFGIYVGSDYYRSIVLARAQRKLWRKVESRIFFARAQIQKLVGFDC